MDYVSNNDQKDNFKLLVTENLIRDNSLCLHLIKYTD